MTLPVTPHPWRELRELPHIEIRWRDLPPELRAVSDGVKRIWMSRRLSQRERRSTLAHELEHIRRQHHGCQSPRVERHVRAMAAQWLLPDTRGVVDEIVFHRGDVDAAAHDLWVDRITLVHRFDPLHTSPMQMAYLRRRLADIVH